MKSLIIGAGGLVGSALARHLPKSLKGIPMEATESNYVYMDIMKYETMFKVFSDYRPDIVYLAAAITNVDKCEDYGTSTVNIRGSTTVLRLCEQFKSKLVFFSSSYVFDGKKDSPYLPDDEPFPVQSYGKQKLTMENLIKNSDLDSIIVRTVGVFGTERKKKNFAKQVLSSVFTGKKVYAPHDQWMNPILSDDLAKISIKLAESSACGVFHVAGDTCVTKYDFARRIASYFNYQDYVVPISSAEMNQRAERPKMGCLDCSSLPVSVPSFAAGIQYFLASEYNA